MAWEHFDVKDSGQLRVYDLEEHDWQPGWYQIGTVSTGKSRVFHGYRVCVSTQDQDFHGSDSHSIHEALRACGARMNAAGFKLRVVGLSAQYGESGMSFNSGSGYLRGQPVSMMCEMHNAGTTDDLDEMTKKGMNTNA